MRACLSIIAALAVTCVCMADQVTIQQGKRDMRQVNAERLAAEQAAAQPVSSVGMSPAMLSLAAPLQVPSADWDVTGFRLSVLYGDCVNFDGLDIGVISRSRGHGNGIQIAGIANIVNGSGVSLQIAPVNVVEGNYSGWQIGVANYAASLPGSEAGTWQIGAFNGAGFIRGFQLGVINFADSMVGIQIGLVNVIRNKDVAFLPIINAAF